MINLVLEKEAIDSVEEIAEHFAEEELKVVVADGRLVEWLSERFEDEIADCVKALGGDTDGEDFTDRLIAALWPDAKAEEAKKARDHVVATRERARAAEAERHRQAQAEAAAVRAEAERRAKEAEAERLAAAEAERRKAQEETEAARAAEAEAVNMSTKQAFNPGLVNKVVNVIVDQLGVNKEQVTLDASLGEDLGADSLDAVELIMAFEEEFGREIPDEDAEKLKTVGDIVEYIKRMEHW